jgi:iron complex transport system substrate-binding protein
VSVRIVSTLPSATEIVCALGLEDELVGVTHECDYPPSVRSKPVVVRSVFDTSAMDAKSVDKLVSEYLRSGRPIYKVDVELLTRLQPDLVVTQEVCDVCAVSSSVVLDSVEKLSKKPEVVTLNPHSLEDVLSDVLRVGEAAGRLDMARRLVDSLEARIQRVKREVSTRSVRPRVVCLEWLDPVYNAGHWLPQMVEYAGGKEVLGVKGAPSRRVGWERVLEADPEHLFLTVCGYDVERTIRELAALASRDGWPTLQAVREGNVYAMNGSWYFSRPGPRLVDGLEALALFLNSSRSQPQNSVGVKLNVNPLAKHPRV